MLDIEQIRAYALGKPSVTEGFPFGETVLVFKAYDKMFLLLPLDTETPQFNVKCAPERALELRERYPDSILPGYHMNKKHWNTIVLDGRLTRQQVLMQIDHSYDLVVPKKKALKG